VIIRLSKNGLNLGHPDRQTSILTDLCSFAFSCSPRSFSKAPKMDSDFISNLVRTGSYSPQSYVSVYLDRKAIQDIYISVFSKNIYQ